LGKNAIGVTIASGAGRVAGTVSREDFFYQEINLVAPS
jgi:hypothetical protein